jgi:WG containing repeat
MKVPILILYIIACTTAIDAQNPRIETLGDRRIETYKYLKGGDSISFTILGKNDTLQKTDFYRNGHPQRKAWKRDSTHNFDELGQLHTIYYDMYKSAWREQNMSNFSNGQLTELKSFKNGVRLEQSYAQNGRLIFTKQVVYAPTYTYERSEDRNGVPITAERTDTLRDNEGIKMFKQDTAFYENGRPYSICNRRNEREYLGCLYFDKMGKLVKTSTPDSLDLVTFKDNVDCYYGLKNKRGDTIIKPRFDRIVNVSGQFWLAYTGEKAIVLQPNGAPMSTPFSALTEIDVLSRTIPFGEFENQSENIDSFRRLDEIKDFERFYTFIDNNKHGLINSKTEIVMPPQYFPLSGSYIGDFKYFEFIVKEGDTLRRSGFVNRQGKSIFPDQYKGVVYTYYEDYFFLSRLPYRRIADCGQSQNYWRSDRTLTNYDYANATNMDTEGVNNLGVGKGDGAIVLEAKYQSITHADSSLFVVSVAKKKKDLWSYDSRNGIYNARTKKWLLDTTEYVVRNDEFKDKPFFIIQHIPTNKYGVMDTKGQYLLSLTYDIVTMPHYRIKNTMFLKKENKYQIATVQNGKINIQKERYEELVTIFFNVMRSSDYLVYFIAKKDNKWGLLDEAGKTVKPFIYDYASHINEYNASFLLVKDNQAEHYGLSSFPNEMEDYPKFNHYNKNPNGVRLFSVADTSKYVFFINKLGKVVIPPQYKEVSYTGELVYLKDAQQKKKFLFTSTGKLVDYPFDYNIEWADPKSSVMLVKDTSAISYGVVSMDGKRIVPCNNYGIAIGDIETSTFFVKKDTPLIKKMYNEAGIVIPETIDVDSLVIEDQNWLMYDKNGKILSDKPFRFPIQFEKGVGIGMKDDDFSLYRTDGSVITIDGVQNFNNIRRIDRFYALFYNQGLTPQLVLTKLDGEVLVKSGHYDGLSKFYGEYALVSKAGKIGLIDRLGKEIIAPQDLTVSTQPIMDSLKAENQLIYENHKKRGFYSRDLMKMPIDFSSSNEEYHPDSLNISPQQRAFVWNLMLQKVLHLNMLTASDVEITRAYIKKNASFINNEYKSTNDEYANPKRIVVSDTTIAFVLTENLQAYKYKTTFYNFYLRHNRWEELKINDLLQIQGEKRWQMNELITKKVKALKDQQIDCSNAAAFITTVENRWMLTKDGIDFCFDSTGGGDFVIVSFTWAELAPFLKMKIF